MDKNSAKALIESLEGATIQGADHATLAQVIEDSLHPLLKEHIFELHYNHHGGRNRENFDTDYELHREIVKFFNEIKHGSFSLSTLAQFQDLQTRLLQGQELERKKGIETDTSILLGIIEDHITQIRPLISPERVRVYLKRGENQYLPAKIDKECVEEIVGIDHVDDDYRRYIRQLEAKKHEYWSWGSPLSPAQTRRILGQPPTEEDIYLAYLKALIAKEKLQQQLAVATTERQDLQNSFTQLSSSETQELDFFKNDRNPKYCSLVYAVKYGEWRLRQLRHGVITINVVHRFE